MKLTVLLLLGLGAAGCHQVAATADEEAAIRQLLERESATWRAGDAAGHAACWQVRPYGRILISTTDGRLLDVPPAAMLALSPSMGQGGHAVNSNYHMHIAGADAWVSHDELSTAKDGQKTYSREIRLLEKINNQWKLVGQSIHLYKP